MKNIGIIGLGNIAHRVAKGILCSSKANLYAVASRDNDKAKNIANIYQATTYYGSYEEMLNDENVDVVYICTPNQLHYEHIKLCLSYKKHVICEKPMVQNVQQVIELFDYAKQQNCFLMEAHKTVFTSLNKKVKQVINQGVIGQLRSIRAEYCCDVLEDVSSDHWVLNKEFGGCSYDIGVYPICFSHYYAQSNMKELIVDSLKHPQFKCDFGIDADIFYENGIYSSIKSNWFYTPNHKGKSMLIGDKGFIEIPAYWKGTKAYLHLDKVITEIRVEMESDFEGEITHAIECIENDLLESPILGEQMSVDIIQVVSKAY